MTKIKAVIGANYGDEGKGLLTDYYCGQAKDRGENAIVICSNGGGQRGHTVSTKDGRRFVFHHLGSGCFQGADTYFSRHYIVNPLIFFQDYESFRKDNKETFHIYMDPECRFSTPYDMMTNQIFEEARGQNRHGSVGVGIWETVRRYEKGHGISVYQMKYRSEEEQIQHLKKVRHYFEERIFQKIGQYPGEMDKWKEIWNQEQLMKNFIRDFELMLCHTPFIKLQDLDCYDNIIIENAQGVLLSQHQYNGHNHTTPSDTGARQIHTLLEEGLGKISQDIEICYVTRSYLTKHGAGNFPEECPVEEIGQNIYDETNMPNPFQGTIRYGKMEEEEVLEHIEKDTLDMVNYRHKIVICITHLNEYVPHMEHFQNSRYEIWGSDGKTRESIIRYGENYVCRYNQANNKSRRSVFKTV